jgi:hypothetical protein
LNASANSMRSRDAMNVRRFLSNEKLALDKPRRIKAAI